MEALVDLGVRFSTSCKSLGIDLLASARRRAKALRARFASLRERLPRIARLRQAGVNAARFPGSVLRRRYLGARMLAESQHPH